MPFVAPEITEIIIPDRNDFGTVAELAARAQAYAIRTLPDDDPATLSLQTAKEHLEAQELQSCDYVCSTLTEGRDTPAATRAAAYLLLGSMRQNALGQLLYVVDIYQGMYDRMYYENSRTVEVRELLRLAEGLKGQAHAAELRAGEEREEAERRRREWLVYEFGEWP